jgi:Domain of unknown function (DUF1996)
VKIHAVTTDGDEKLRAMQARLADLLPRLNERDRRLALATEAKSWGHGGITAVHEATGVPWKMIQRGMAELPDDSTEGHSDRVRTPKLVARNPKSPIRNALGPVVRVRCAEALAELRRDQRETASVVARTLMHDDTLPRHVRCRAACDLARWKRGVPARGPRPATRPTCDPRTSRVERIRARWAVGDLSDPRYQRQAWLALPSSGHQASRWRGADDSVDGVDGAPLASSRLGIEILMARGERWLSAAARRVAAAATLLAIGGIVAVIGTADTASGGTGSVAGRVQVSGPIPGDFVPVELMAPTVKRARSGSAGSTGSFTSHCGTNVEGHRNADNFMTAPGKVNGAQHVHDYVGNLSTNAFSTEESLAAAGTTCGNGDKSSYFWPVLRDTRLTGVDANARGGGLDGNVGEILRPTRVRLEFRGNPTGRVSAMPDHLSLMTGDAKAATNGGADANAAWTCTGFEDRTTTKYPLCPQGSQLVRILDFPSCWDGKNMDSPTHRTHVVFPRRDGSCGAGTVIIPQLRITLTYDRPAGTGFAVDAFPGQRHKPITDHADFMSLMPPTVRAQAVDCINTGRTCAGA